MPNCVAALVVLLAIAPARAATLTIGFVDLADDPRHEDVTGSGGLVIETRGRPFDGAALGMRDVTPIGRAVGVEIELIEARAASPTSFAAAVKKLHDEHDAHFILIDAPAETVKEAAKSAGADLLLFNISAEADSLRGADCTPGLLHLIPSRAMRTDALAQYIVAHKWREVLVLQGPAPHDAEFVTDFERSAKRFGARIVARRPFVLGSDPRQRDQNNLALLTEGSYDVVFVADESREVARLVPYQTLSPRPVIGDAGLGAFAWHWAWERGGGPNLSRRFERLTKRKMRSADWAAWAGVKAVAEAVLHTKSAAFEPNAAFLKSPELRLDGSKGEALSFRPWDNQLRQPVQLATDTAVIAQAPLPQFLHATENLDTLGADRPDSACRLGGGR